MELDWSVQSPHIRTLFRPWQPGDGYDEVTLEAMEERLGIHLPTLLKTFYRAWGRRKDLTQVKHFLLDPDELVSRADTLILWVENQGVCYWGIRREMLEEADPPVVITFSGLSGWEVESELNWKPSHAHLSDFLDDMTYLHAFCGGAINGGYTAPFISKLPPHHMVWLEECWNKATVTAWGLGLSPDSTISHWPTLYVRDGQALKWVAGCSVAAREAELVDEIAQRFQLTWAHRW